MRLPAVSLLLLLLAFSACTESGGGSSGEAGRTGKGVMELEDLKAGTLWKLEPRDGYGYRIVDGSGAKVGAVKVQADRVKVKDASDQPRAKVKKKDAGFKLYDGDTVVLKGKDRGDRLKITDASDNKRAKLTDGALRVGQAKIHVKSEGEVLKVFREEDALFALRGDAPSEAAMLYGWTDLDPYQRVALLVFLREVY